MPIKIPFKRGDTFSLQCTVADSASAAQDITGWGIRAQVRDADVLVAELEALTIDAARGVYRLRKAHNAATAPTSAWPVKVLAVDVEYTTDSGDVISTETFLIDCKADVTR